MNSLNNEKIFILGPCSIESKELFFEIAEKIIPLMNGRDFYLKASFDKANRSSINGNRGPGLIESIQIWKEFKRYYPDVKLTTDIHETYQVGKISGIIDLIQIPAFLSMQTDLTVAAASSCNKVNIKKMQCLGPERMCISVDKAKSVNPDCEVWLTERGTNVGYYDLYVDFGAVKRYKKSFDKVILDATHSAQRSRQVYVTQADRDLCERYFLSSDIFGYDGVFAEVHPNPPQAFSDADSQLWLSEFESLLEKSNKIERIING